MTVICSLPSALTDTLSRLNTAFEKSTTATNSTVAEPPNALPSISPEITTSCAFVEVTLALYVPSPLEVISEMTTPSDGSAVNVKVPEFDSRAVPNSSRS